MWRSSPNDRSAGRQIQFDLRFNFRIADQPGTTPFVDTSAFLSVLIFENAANLELPVIRPLSNGWGRERDGRQSIRIDGFLSTSA